MPIKDSTLGSTAFTSLTSPFLPRNPRGRPTEETKTKYAAEVKVFCSRILEIHQTMDFRVGVRGWCYILEARWGLLKGEFPACEKLITDCRKSGDLPYDICDEDASRKTICLEEIDDEDDPERQAENWVDWLLNYAHLKWKPVSFWHGLNVYIEVAVEKLDLRNLFEPVCKELHVPITNFKGWYDVNQRAAMMRRFKYHESMGRQCFLLTCTDHDPGGLIIHDFIRENFEEMAHAYSDAEGPIDWDPKNLKIIRFGLNKDFIDRHNLSWIPNLETSSGKRLDDPNHKDHGSDYVQNYIREFGVRKCEANALVVVPQMGRQLVRDAIMQHLPEHALHQYQNRLNRQRGLLQAAIRKLFEGEE
jgi:hypothetical protein